MKFWQGARLMHTWMPIAAAFALLACSGTTMAQGARPGIAGSKAPRWTVTEWINLPADKRRLNIDDFEGKVLYLYGFQSWCPGCHARGFPTLKELLERYENADDVAFVAVQTVFEGFQTNTAEAAWETARRYELDIPVGHDGRAGRPSVLMQQYRTGGTPWAVIIDKRGLVRWNGFHISAADASRLIDTLRTERAPARRDIVTLPPQRGGQDRVGTRFPKLRFDRWVRSGAEAKERPRATLYRWWTDTCPYCRASLPAVETLRRRYEEKGLRVVAVYHPKPPRDVGDADVLAAAKATGYQGTIAVDQDWSELDRAYLSSGQRRATSVTFLVDADGVTRFLQPGPVFFPSDDPAFAQENRDYELLTKAIEALLDDDS